MIIDLKEFCFDFQHLENLQTLRLILVGIAMLRCLEAQEKKVSEDCIFAPQLHIALLVNLYSFHVLHVIVCVYVFGCHFLLCF